MAASKNEKYGVLSDVVFAYAKIAESTKKYQSEDREYTIDCIVDKTTAKSWNKQFPKQKAKEIDKEDFVEKYKMEAPFSGDEVYVIKLKKGASKDGEDFDEKWRPKVLLDTKEDGRVDITTSRLISNGSRGKASYYISENSFGTFGQLNNILMDEEGFIEYKSTSGGPGSEFGDGKAIKKVEPASESATRMRATKEAEKSGEDKVVKKTKKEVEPEPEEDDSFEAPF